MLSSFTSEPNSSVSTRRKKINNNISKFFDKKRLDENILKETVEVENEIKRNTLAMDVADYNVNSKVKKRRQNIMNEEFRKNKIDELITESLVYIVYNALNLDESFKEHNLDYIDETVKTFMKGLKENKCLSIPKYSAIDDIKRKITMIFDENKDNLSNIDDKILVRQIKEACSFEFETSISMIKNKVLNTINEEKQYSEYLDNCKNEDISNKELRKGNNTLFRNIFEGNISAIIKQESENENSKLTKKNIMDIALSEAIMDYTLLETIHTLKMADINVCNIKKLDCYFK